MSRPSALSSAPPSATLHQIEVSLHGLSFSKYNNDHQLETLSQTLSDLLTYAASGLLLADHGPSQFQSTLQNLTILLTTPRITPLITWKLISLTDADTLAIQYFTHASNHLLDTGPDDSNFSDQALLQAAQYLNAATELLQLSADAPTRRSAAANQAAARFLHVYLFLRHTNHAHIISQPFDIFRRMRRAEILADCIVPVFPTLQPLLLRACTLQPDVYRDAQIATPASVIADVCVCFSAHEKLQQHIHLFLDVLLPLVEDVDTETRTLAAEALHTILTQLPDRDVHQNVGRLAPVLRGALVWRDASTARVVAPVLARVLRLMRGESGLRDYVDTEWERGAGELVKVVEALGAVREHVTEGLEAGILVAMEVTGVMRERLLRRAVEWVSLVGGVMARVAAEVGKACMCVKVFEKAVAVVIEAMQWTWLLEREYRVKLFGACIMVVFEVRNCKEEVRKLVWDGTERVLICLARCEGRDGVLKLLLKMRKQARKYPSLKSGENFLATTESKLRAELETGKYKAPIVAGQFMKKFFIESL